VVRALGSPIKDKESKRAKATQTIANYVWRGRFNLNGPPVYRMARTGRSSAPKKWGRGLWSPSKRTFSRKAKNGRDIAPQLKKNDGLKRVDQRSDTNGPILNPCPHTMGKQTVEGAEGGQSKACGRIVGGRTKNAQTEVRHWSDKNV